VDSPGAIQPPVLSISQLGGTDSRRSSRDYLVLALGQDTAKVDPTGIRVLRAADFRANGALIGTLDAPTLIVQEGGYRTRTLGANARAFFEGLWAGWREARSGAKRRYR
jgi:acetoin utilization deacetylase AcuC-like enzyme